MGCSLKVWCQHDKTSKMDMEHDTFPTFFYPVNTVRNSFNKRNSFVSIWKNESLNILSKFPLSSLHSKVAGKGSWSVIGLLPTSFPCSCFKTPLIFFFFFQLSQFVTQWKRFSAYSSELFCYLSANPHSHDSQPNPVSTVCQIGSYSGCSQSVPIHTERAQNCGLHSAEVWAHQFGLLCMLVTKYNRRYYRLGVLG